MKKTRIYEGIEVIDLETVRSAKYEENIERYGDHSNTCFLCGKRTAETLHVHYTTDGFLVPTGFDLDEVELSIRGIESQGCFPVGSECAKKVGKTYLVHIVK